MSIASNNKIRSLEQRIIALENAFSILAKSQVNPELAELRKHVDDEIRAMKARMGKIRETA